MKKQEYIKNKLISKKQFNQSYKTLKKYQNGNFLSKQKKVKQIFRRFCKIGKKTQWIFPFNRHNK